MKTTILSACLSTAIALAAVPAEPILAATASVPTTGSDSATAAFSQAELDQMMAPVALYPDSLLSQVLMASTYPDQVAQAVKWSQANPNQQGDAAVTAVQDQGWDPSVASLVAFPQVLATMGEKPDWVKQMGDAFLAESEKVMDTVQNLRKKAKEAGNLESSEQQKVTTDQSDGQTVIIIEPADPKVVYVPAYNPTVIYGTWWWPAYPPFYYYPPGYGFAAGVITGIGFGIGIGITNSLWGGCNWRGRDVNINVNRYNNININNKLNVKQNNLSWKQQNSKRRESARANLGNRKKPSNKLSGADRRQDFRGRDAERDKARQTLKGKGIDPASERKKLTGSGGDRVRNDLNKKRPSDSLGRRSDKTSGIKRDTPRASSGSKDRVSGVKRDTPRTSSGHKDNAFSGVGEKRRGGLNTERGRSSQRSSQRSGGGGGRGFSGGGGGRGAGGGRRGHR